MLFFSDRLTIYLKMNGLLSIHWLSFVYTFPYVLHVYNFTSVHPAVLWLTIVPLLNI